MNPSNGFWYKNSKVENNFHLIYLEILMSKILFGIVALCILLGAAGCTTTPLPTSEEVRGVETKAGKVEQCEDVYILSEPTSAQWKKFANRSSILNLFRKS